MASKDKKDKRDQAAPKPPPVEAAGSDDLEKTVVDIDLSMLEGFQKEASTKTPSDTSAPARQKISQEAPVEDETVVVRLPPEEDSGVYDDAFFKDEDTGRHQAKASETPVKASSSEAPKSQSSVASTRPISPKAMATPPEVKTSQAKTSPKSPPKKSKVKKTATPLSSPRLVKLSWLYHLLMLLPVGILWAAVVENLRFGLGWKRLSLLGAALSLLIWLVSVWRRWDPRKALVWVWWLAFSVFAYGAFFYPGSEQRFALGLSYSQWVGWMWFIGVILGLVSLVGTRSVKWLAKGLALVAGVITLLALVISLSQGQVFESAFWQPVSWVALPWWLKPVPLTLIVSLPLLALVALGAWLRGGKQRLSWLLVLPVILWGVVGGMLGPRLLAKQGLTVPGLNAWVGERYYGQTLVDPQSSEIELQVVAPHGIRRSALPFDLQVAATRSRAQGDSGKAKTSLLLVRNPEAKPFLSTQLTQALRLSRGTQKVKGGKIRILKERIGQPRHLVVVLDSSVFREETSERLQHLGYGIRRILKFLSPGDGLTLCQPPAACESLSARYPEKWDTQLSKVLVPVEQPLSPPQVWSAVTQTLRPRSGLTQILYVTEGNKMPPIEIRQAWGAQAKQKKASLSYIVLGEVEESSPHFYPVTSPAALGFQMLSAAAESLGHFQLQLPHLNPLPKILLSQGEDGEVLLPEGKLSFRIMAKQKGLVNGLRLIIDEKINVDLDPKKFQHNIDLATLKLLPGQHQFRIELLSVNGDVLSEKFSADYLTKSKLQFVKPLAQDTLSSRSDVLLKPASYPGVASLKIELWLDGVLVGSASREPYLFSLSELKEGEHELQAVQSFAGGQTQSAQIRFQTQLGAPTLKVLRPSNGELLANVAELESEVEGLLLETADKVEYLLNGEWVGESTQPPYPFLWSNQDLPAAAYYVQARAYFSNGRQTSDAVRVQLGEGSLRVQANPAEYPGGKLFPEHVSFLIDASARMERPLGGYFPLDLARLALQRLTKILPKSVSLQTYALGGATKQGASSCLQVAALKESDQDLQTLKAKAQAPLALGLIQIQKKLKKVKGSRVGIVLTGGWDRCGGDPIEAAEQLKRQFPGFRLYVLYLAGLPATEVSLLQRLASVTGGKAYEITQPQDLLFALREAIQVHYTLYDFKNKPVLTQALSAAPVKLRAGTYRLELSTVPALVRDPLIIGAGSTESLSVEKRGQSFGWSESAEAE